MTCAYACNIRVADRRALLKRGARRCARNCSSAVLVLISTPDLDSGAFCVGRSAAAVLAARQFGQQLLHVRKAHRLHQMTVASRLLRAISVTVLAPAGQRN